MKIFVLGKSKVGKSTFAKTICNLAPSFQHIQGSEWIRKKCSPSATREELTAQSLELLKKNPNVCIDFIKCTYDLTKSTIIEGFRNPHDFANLFNSTLDRVVFLFNSNLTDQESSFDLGVDVIEQYVDFQTRMDILDTSKVWKHSVRGYEDVVNVAKLYAWMELGVNQQ